jgi:hypothetical protein
MLDARYQMPDKTSKDVDAKIAPMDESTGLLPFFLGPERVVEELILDVRCRMLDKSK